MQLGDEAPNFQAETTEGLIDFHSFIEGNWCVFFSHPKDFTPVCTTELGRVAKIKDEFSKRNCKVIAISVDDLESHKGWIKDIEETQQVKMNFPIVADSDRSVSKLYGMIHPKADNTLTVRTVFIIGPDKKVKLMITYPASTGRNFEEILRVLDSVQLTVDHKVATPVDWKVGDECVVLPTILDSELKSLFPKGTKEVKPYLRFTPDPR